MKEDNSGLKNLMRDNY